MHKALDTRNDSDSYICQEKKEEKNLPALMITSIMEVPVV